MTLTEAKTLLKCPLVFGDEGQVRAVNFISKAEELADKIKVENAQDSVCPNCIGSGQCTCICGDTHDCEECHGLGFDEDLSEELAKAISYDYDVTAAAIEIVKQARSSTQARK